jgi:membrane-associated protease RseP (regulator of RpoE activity)
MKLRKLCTLALAIALSNSALAARTAEEIQAEMQALGKKMSELGKELSQVQGGSDNKFVMHFSSDGDSGKNFSFPNLESDLQRISPRLGLVMEQTASNAPVTISAVTPDSGAEKAGLKAGDQIVSVRGQAAGATMADVRKQIGTVKHGDVVPLEVLRDGKKIAVNATASNQLGVIMLDSGKNKVTANSIRLGDLNALKDLGALGPEGVQTARIIMRKRDQSTDLEMIKLEPELGAYFGATSGALVLAAKGYAPLLAGDVIQSVDGAAVTGPVDVAQKITQAGEAGINVSVLRQKQARSFVVKRPAE